MHKFIKSLIETEFGITFWPSTSGKPMSNAILEIIHDVLGNLVRTFKISTQTYVDKYDPWTGILAAVSFSIISTTVGKSALTANPLTKDCASD